MNDKTFLIEICTEELPFIHLQKILEYFSESLTHEMKILKIKYSDVNWFVTTRRLAAQFFKLNIAQSVHVNEKCTVENISNKKKSFMEEEKTFIEKELNKTYKCILQKLINNAFGRFINLMKLNFYKQLDIFCLIQTVTVLIDKHLLNIKIFGKRSMKYTRSNRSIDCDVFIDKAKNYSSILRKKGKVLANFNCRKSKIKSEIYKLVKNICGVVNLEEKLLDNITGLVEWPVALLAKFKKTFLKLPIEILIYVIQTEQNYVPVYDKYKKLLPVFIVISNVECKNNKHIINSIETVINARLSDAMNAIKNDIDKPLSDYLYLLKNIVFQENLGNLMDKTCRIIVISNWLAKIIDCDRKLISRAALLSKCDLATSIIRMFSNLRGVIGMYYSKISFEARDVAYIIRDHYKPDFPNDTLPTTIESCILSISDKIDTIVGIFIIEQNLKNKNDPFKLRRLANGILRILTNKYLKFNLRDLISYTIMVHYSNLGYNNHLIHIKNIHLTNEILHFIIERLYNIYSLINIKRKIVKSVLLSSSNIDISDIDKKIKAIHCFLRSYIIFNITTIYKRVTKLLYKTGCITNVDAIDNKLLKTEIEYNLVRKIKALQKQMNISISNKCYEQALVILYESVSYVSNFLNMTKINTTDLMLRYNRLIILNFIKKLYLKIADFSELNLKKNF